MYANVMVPLDGSTFSDHALPLARGIARRAGSTLHLVLVHTPLSLQAPESVPFGLLNDWERDTRERERLHLERRAEELTGEGLEVRTRLLDGDTCDELVDAAESMDLVVLASHGRGGLERAWLGSVADHLIRHVHPPVLVVRPPESPGGSMPDPVGRVRHVLAATSGSAASDAAVDHAVSLVRLCDARLTLLAVAHTPGGLGSPYIPHTAVMDAELTETREAEAHRYLREVAARYPGVPIAARVWKSYHTARGILDAAAHLEPDLLVVGTHRRTAVGRALLGSVADKVVRASPVPVLVGHRQPVPVEDEAGMKGRILNRQGEQPA